MPVLARSMLIFDQTKRAIWNNIEDDDHEIGGHGDGFKIGIVELRKCSLAADSADAHGYSIKYSLSPISVGGAT